MLQRLLDIILYPFFALSEEESKQANECKQRTLNILNDALKKKDALLVENPTEFSDREKFSYFPLISTDLVKDLISQLQKVTFRRGKSVDINVYVRSTDGNGTMYLCSQFWKQHEFLQHNSRPETLIYEISRLVEYENTTKKNTEKVKNSEHNLCPISVPSNPFAFSYCMVHKGSYTNGSFSCCGETSRDTVCEKSITSYVLGYLYDMKDSLLSEEEHKSANEAKERALNILNDALKKKDALLVNNPAEFSDREKFSDFPLISTDLVKDLISQLQKVTFRRGKSLETNTYVRSTDGNGTMYLSSQFWKQHEFLQHNSRPETLIYEISRLVEYENTIKKNTEKVKNSEQHKLCPISAPSNPFAFSYCMVHEGSYTNGSYSCCGETSRDTVCEKSITSYVLGCLYDRKVSLLSEEECKSAIEAKERALNILNDALKKKDSLLVDDPEEFRDEKKLRLYLLISTDLVKDLISQLEKVTFKRNKDPEEEIDTIAYVYPISETETIYLCQGFWELPEFLAMRSRPKTLIHEVSHLLGYGHTIEENKEKVEKSEQHKLFPVSVHSIERAFSIHMNHRESYTNGSYSCCGETSRDTLCEKSSMADKLRIMRDLRDKLREIRCKRDELSCIKRHQIFSTRNLHETSNPERLS